MVLQPEPAENVKGGSVSKHPSAHAMRCGCHAGEARAKAAPRSGEAAEPVRPEGLCPLPFTTCLKNQKKEAHMKNYISIILTAAMTLTLAACTAAPDPAPLATPTPEPTAAPAAPTPAPAAADFYTLKSYDGSFDDGTAYYEFTQRLGYALLLKTDYATAVQSVCCAVPGCGHDTDACPAYFPGRAGRYTVVAAGDTVYVWHISFFYDDQSWDDYWAEKLASGVRDREPFDTLTDAEFEAEYRGIWTEQTTPPCLYAVDPAAGKTRTDLPLTYRDYTVDVCDGSTLYGERVTIPYRTQVSPGRIGPTPACRIDLATGQAETFVLEPTEHYLAGFDGALLTCRYVADAPLPTDAEQYAAAIQSATVEIDRLDPRMGARTSLTERPYSNADYENNGCFIGVYNGKAYFEEREIIPGSGFRRTVLTTVDAEGRAETVWDPWPQAEWVLGDDGGRYIWLYRDNYNTSYAACALLDTETGQITPVTQALQTGSGAVSLRGKAHDGRWLVVIGADSVGRTTAYGLIDADQFAAGSTDWQPVTMWQG